MTEQAAKEFDEALKKLQSKQYIEIDRAPGTARPDSYIGQVVAGTALEPLVKKIKDKDIGKFFGNWTWYFLDVDPEVWKEVQKVTAPRLTELYNSGYIRYASW